MDARLQRRVQRSGWDKAAAYYEQFWQDQLKPAHDQLMEMAELEAGESVLDVACGTGLVSFRASRGKRDACGWAGIFEIVDRGIRWGAGSSCLPQVQRGDAAGSACGSTAKKIRQHIERRRIVPVVNTLS